MPEITAIEKFERGFSTQEDEVETLIRELEKYYQKESSL